MAYKKTAKFFLYWLIVQAILELNKSVRIMCILFTHQQTVDCLSNWNTKESLTQAWYQPLFIKCMLDVLNSGRPVKTFIKEFNMKNLSLFLLINRLLDFLMFLHLTI